MKINGSFSGCNELRSVQEEQKRKTDNLVRIWIHIEGKTVKIQDRMKRVKLKGQLEVLEQGGEGERKLVFGYGKTQRHNKSGPICSRFRFCHVSFYLIPRSIFINYNYKQEIMKIKFINLIKLAIIDFTNGFQL